MPLTFFSKGLGFGVSEASDKIKIYGKNMYIVRDSEDKPYQSLEVYSKDDVGEVTPRTVNMVQ